MVGQKVVASRLPAMSMGEFEMSMSRRLHVAIPEALDARLRRMARRLGISKAEYVRRVLASSLRKPLKRPGRDPLAELAALKAPTGDIDEILAEIIAGRS